ncbi:MAG: hypothetical protein MJ252_22700 [archaeon]|nr:hypothetical protein [archaeon]
MEDDKRLKIVNAQNQAEILNIFYSLDYENKACVDCQGALPIFVSINHGIFLCESCARRHNQLGHNISYVRNVNDGWDFYLVDFVLRGGNSRFKRFLRDYGLEGKPIEVKYMTLGVQNYRLVLKSEVEAEVPPAKIDKSYASMQCQSDIEFFPEFYNYQLFKGEKFEKTNKFSEAYSYLKNQMSENKVGEKMIYGGGILFNVMKATGKFVYNTSKPVVKFIGKTALKGVDSAIQYMIEDKNETPKAPPKKEDLIEEESNHFSNQNQFSIQNQMMPQYGYPAMNNMNYGNNYPTFNQFPSNANNSNINFNSGFNNQSEYFPPNQQMPFNPNFRNMPIQQLDNPIINNPLEEKKEDTEIKKQIRNGYEIWDLGSDNKEENKDKKNEFEIMEHNNEENKTNEEEEIEDTPIKEKTKIKTNQMNKKELKERNAIEKYQKDAEQQIKDNFYNSDKRKARNDANDFLMKP